MSKRKKTVLIILCVMAGLFSILKIHYAVGNHRYNNRMNELQNKMNLQIEHKIDHRTIENNGNTIHYFVSGNEEGETIVFLHPAFGDHQCFDRQIDCFSPDYRVITVDMLGRKLP